MTRFDFSPLFRSAIGYDHLENMINQMERSTTVGSSYPPYNIEKKDENSYQITMAVAGFALSDLEIIAQENALIVKGHKQDGSNSTEAQMLHRGIATRDFEQRFKLADFVEVKAASLDHGILHIELLREVPERMKPKTIEIKQNGLLEKVKKLSSNSSKAA